MASLSDLTAGVSPVVAYPKSIQFGPVTLDGYMLETGEFRQSVRSTGAALGMASNSSVQNLVLMAGQNASDGNGSSVRLGENMATQNPVVQPVRCPGIPGHGGVAYTINLPMVVEVWKQVAIGGGKYARAALELLGLSAVHSLERTYQEAFGVSDSRNTQDRLLDWAIRLDAGKHFPLFGGEFHRHFARVTGYAIGHNYARVCLAELVYHRLPAPVYETLKDLNPFDPETGWRQFSHSQLMTDDMRQYVREIVMAVTNQLANTPSKAEDPSGYAKLLHRLDKTLPRHRSRRGLPPKKEIAA